MADVGAADLKGAKKLKTFLQFVPHRNSFAVFSKFSIAQRPKTGLRKCLQNLLVHKLKLKFIDLFHVKLACFLFC